MKKKKEEGAYVSIIINNGDVLIPIVNHRRPWTSGANLNISFVALQGAHGCPLSVVIPMTDGRHSTGVPKEEVAKPVSLRQQIKNKQLPKSK